MLVILLITGSTVAAFATLGDGKSPVRKNNSGRSLLTNKTRTNQDFSLRSGYDFRGNHVIDSRHHQYVNLNTTLTYRKGGINYILPVKRKIVLDKFIFNADLLRNSKP